MIIVALGLWVRIWIAPYTTGSDIPQFAGFADTFLRRGLCFYMYSDGRDHIAEGWPYPWPYPYGPLPILLLAIARLFAGTKVKFFWVGDVYYVYTPIEWIEASKLIFRVFDTFSALLIFVILSKVSMRRALAATAFYYLNPVTIYVSSIYGMIDPIALALYLLALALPVIRPAERLGLALMCFLLGLAVTTKTLMLFPVVLTVLYILLVYRDRKSLAVAMLSFIAGSLVLYIPFEIACPGSLAKHINVLRDVSRPGYTEPIVYSFNGFSSLATYLHSKSGNDFLWVVEYWWIPATVCLAILAYVVARCRDRLSIIAIAYLAYLVYVTVYWRVNYQYFTPLIGLASLYIFYPSKARVGRLLALLHALLVALWLYMFPISWWAHVHIENPSREIINLLDSLSLMVFAEEIYVLYSVMLTVFGYITLAVSCTSLYTAYAVEDFGSRGFLARVLELFGYLKRAAKRFKGVDVSGEGVCSTY